LPDGLVKHIEEYWAQNIKSTKMEPQ